MCSRNCWKLERAGHTSRWGGFGEDMVVEQKPGREGVTTEGPGCGGRWGQARHGWGCD